MINKLSLKIHTNWVYILCLLYIAINAYLISQEFFYFTLFPLALLVVFIAICRLDILVFATVFLTPLSISLNEFVDTTEFNLYLPTEPLLFGILVLFIVKLLMERNYDKKILRHPVSLAIYFNLIWIFITCITSTDPLVSFKYFTARLWFLASFYFIAIQLFKNFKNIKRYIWLYVIPFIFVIAITIAKHSTYGLLDMKASHTVVSPFFNDHTSYGAMLAMFLPVLGGLAVLNLKKKRITNFVIWFIIALFSGALILSYTRAAWVSLITACCVFIILILKIKLRTLIIFLVIVGAFIYSMRVEITHKLEKNRQESSSDLAEHVQSISNIASDASNLERINRWQSALRMFKEKPFFGFGPGTYMFEYAPYQVSYEKTIISTNFGDLGNAHSEYIGPLAESGILGSVSFTLIVILTIITGVRVYKYAANREVKILSMVLLLGLTTYYIHGLLNNFLDTDKASAPFWGFTAMLVAMDIFFIKKAENKESKTLPSPKS